MKPRLLAAFVVFDGNHKMIGIYPTKDLALARIDWLELSGDQRIYWREITYWYTH